MHKDDELLLQLCIICVLLLLIGVTAVMSHPDWFSRQYNADPSDAN